MAEKAAARGSDGSKPLPMSGCFVRLGWIVGGNVLLAMLAVLIARGERWTLSPKDAAFLVILGAAVALRYVDWKRFGGTTADGEPATLHHFRRYVAWHLGSWSGAWTVAQTLELG